MTAPGQAQEGADNSGRPSRRAPGPWVIAHRGLSGLCPENTLPGFAAAVAMGADEIELDLWASRDGELVVCHDPDLDRTTNGQGRIADWDWDQLRRLDAGIAHGRDWAGVPLCRLQDVFDGGGGRVVMNLHLKEPGVEGLVIRKTRELAVQRGLVNRVYLAGEKGVLEWAIRVAPDIERCCLECFDGVNVVDHALQFGCRRVQFWSPRYTPADIAKAHAHGMLCNLFSGDRPDTPEEAGRAFDAGVDAVLTDWANKILPVARQRSGRPAPPVP